MPEKKKITVGQQFIKLLENAAKDKNRLLDLASGVIKRSHSKRGLKNRNLPDSESAVKLNASIAKFNAMAGKDVSTDGMLAMIVKKSLDLLKNLKKILRKNIRQNMITIMQKQHCWLRAAVWLLMNDYILFLLFLLCRRCFIGGFILFV